MKKRNKIQRTKSNGTLKNVKSLLRTFVMIAFILNVLWFMYPEKFSELISSFTNSPETEKTREIPSGVNIQQRKEPPAVTLKEVDMSEFKKYNFSYVNTIKIDGVLNELDYKLYVPQNEYAKQYVKINSVSLKPQSIEKEGLNKVYRYSAKNISTQIINIVVNGVAQIRKYDLQTAKRLNYNISPENDLSRYLRSEKFIESDDPFIKSIADRINGNTKEEILQNIYVFLQNNIKYTVTPNLGAKGTLQKKIGKCTDYACAMVAICRAKNIPARIVAGNVTDETVGPHAWVEVYFDEYGWVMYDPTFQGVFIKKNINGVIHTERKLDASTLHFDYLSATHDLLQRNTTNYKTTHGTNGRAYTSDSFRFSVNEDVTE